MVDLDGDGLKEAFNSLREIHIASQTAPIDIKIAFNSLREIRR